TWLRSDLDDILSLNLEELRLDFTIEDANEVRNILDLYDKAFNQNQPFTYKEDYTKGHLKRGVE
ncbi:hypothetical protein, partial [Pseudobutyrivibrio sp.]